MQRESRRVESGSEETGEWPSEGGLNGKFSQVGSDGNPPVIRGVRMMVRKSEWTSQDVNLGGIAEVLKRFCPSNGAEAFFYILHHLPPQFLIGRNQT